MTFKGSTFFDSTPRVRRALVERLALGEPRNSKRSFRSWTMECDREIKTMLSDLRGDLKPKKERAVISRYLADLCELRASLIVALGRAKAVREVVELCGQDYPFPLNILTELERTKARLEIIDQIGTSWVRRGNSSTWYDDNYYPIGEQVARYVDSKTDSTYSKGEIFVLEFGLNIGSFLHKLIRIHFGKPIAEAGKEADVSIESYLEQLESVARWKNQPLYMRSFANSLQIGIDRIHCDPKRTTFVAYHIPNDWSGNPSRPTTIMNLVRTPFLLTE